MLLSDLIRLSKYKGLYESFQPGSIILKYNKQYKDHKLYYTYDIADNYYTELNRVVKRFIYKFSKYDTLWKENVYYIDTLKKFDYLYFNKFEKRQDQIAFRFEQRNENTFIKLLRKIIPEAETISFDKIENMAFENIPVNKARSSKYADYYMFWENANGDLTAITHKGKIIAFFYNYGKVFSPNPDYKDENIGDLVHLANNDEELWEIASEWVMRAYNYDVVYDLRIDPKALKKLIGTTSAIILQKAGTDEISTPHSFIDNTLSVPITTVYGISPEVLKEKYSAEEKVQARKDYKAYLEEETKRMANKITDYKRRAKILKYSREYDNLVLQLNNTMTILEDCLRCAREVELNRLMDFTQKETTDPVHRVRERFDYYGETFHHFNRYLADMIQRLVDIQTTINDAHKASNAEYNEREAFFHLNTLKNEIARFNARTSTLAEERYSYEYKSFDVIKNFMTPEQIKIFDKFIGIQLPEFN